MTRLYFHAASSTITGTKPSTSQSALTPTDIVEPVTVNRSMNETIGTTQASLTIVSAGDGVYYYTRFISEPIQGTSITAQTWTYNFAAAQASLDNSFPVRDAAQPVRITLYVWRPGTGAKVGNILDGNSALVYDEPTVINTELSMHGTFTGAALTINSGDVLCFEVIFDLNKGAGDSGNDTFYYDGNTVTTIKNQAVSNHASFIETPQSLPFGTGSVTPVTCTVTSAAVRNKFINKI